MIPRHIVVLGGGVVGHLVGLRHPGSKILDWGTPPRGRKTSASYGANYLWEPIPELTCEKIDVVTHVDGRVPTAESIAAYKRKIGKENDGGDWSRQFQHETSGWEIVKIPEIPVLYQQRVVEINLRSHWVLTGDGQMHPYDILVSCIPLPSFLGMFSEPLIPSPSPGTFRSDPISVVVGPRPPDAPYPVDTMYVDYRTNPNNAVYRVVDRRMERHWEGLGSLSVTPSKLLKPGKIHPTVVAKQYRDWLSSFDVFCFGRYAAWEPDELLHETYLKLVQWGNTL